MSGVYLLGGRIKEFERWEQTLSLFLENNKVEPIHICIEMEWLLWKDLEPNPSSKLRDGRSYGLVSHQK